MVETFTLFIDKPLDARKFNKLMEYLPNEKKEKIRRFYRVEDAQRGLWGDILGRYCICRRLGIKNSDISFGFNPYGKPYLLQPGNIEFNISHSGDWVVCAVDNEAVGIDVEQIKPIDFKIAERFFSSEECLALFNKSEDTRLKFFYILWTLKESFIKAEGKGMSIPLDSFTIFFEGDVIRVNSLGKPQPWFFNQYQLDSRHMFAVCARNNNFIDRVNLDTERFYEEVLHCL